jgi:hypothetical protein
MSRALIEERTEEKEFLDVGGWTGRAYFWQRLLDDYVTSRDYTRYVTGPVPVSDTKVKFVRDMRLCYRIVTQRVSETVVQYYLVSEYSLASCLIVWRLREMAEAEVAQPAAVEYQLAPRRTVVRPARHM